MDIHQLIGRQVHVRATDLFDSPVAALIRAIDLDSKSLFLEFVAPAQVGAKTCPFAVARPRLQRDGLSVLLSSGTLGCAVTCIPRDRYDATKPFDLSWWRGGGAGIGDVIL